jgi:hypothetical protein
MHGCALPYEQLEALPDGLIGELPDGFTLVPAWICEVLSPPTESKDREIKMPIYARYSVAHAWLLRCHGRSLIHGCAGLWRLPVEATRSVR